MATVRQKNVLVTLIPILDEVSKFNPESLMQRERLGTAFSLEFALPLFIEVITTAQNLLKIDLEKVPFGILNQFHGAFQNIRNLLNQVSSFDPTKHGSPANTRDSYVQGIEDQWNNIYILIRSILGGNEDDITQKQIEVLSSQVKSSIQLSSDAAEHIKAKQAEAESSLSEFLKNKSEQFQREGEKKLELIDRALEEVRNAAAEAGVSQTSKYFKDEADEHHESAKYWLIATAIFMASLILFSLFGTGLLNVLGTHEPDPSAANIVQIKYYLQRGVIDLCLILAVLLSIKNYSASKHNYVVNKHRNNALGSFQAFAASANDEQTKSAVLVQATQSIFSPQATGYVKTDGENSPQSPIIEIMRSVGVVKDK